MKEKQCCERDHDRDGNCDGHPPIPTDAHGFPWIRKSIAHHESILRIGQVFLALDVDQAQQDYVAKKDKEIAEVLAEMKQLLACHEALVCLVKNTLAKKPFTSPEMVKLFEKAEVVLEGKA